MNGWVCSGFLVGPSLLLTNHHCIFTDANDRKHQLQDIKVYMDYYGDDWKGGVSAGVLSVREASREYDYALLLLDKRLGDTYGWLEFDLNTPSKGRSVKIIQHPRGRPKEISRKHSSITKVYADALHYQADTEGGSSGSPVFYSNGSKVIAIHHAGVEGYWNEGVLMKNIFHRISWEIAESIYNWGYFKYYEQGEYNSAIDAFNKVLGVASDYPMAYRDRGISKYRLKRYNDAIDDLSQTIRMLPKGADAYFWRGRAKYMLKRYNDAINDFNQVDQLSLSPKHTNGYYWRGKTKYMLGRYEAAIADFTESIRLNPKYANAYHWRGDAKYQLGRHEAAIADFTESIRLNPKYRAI